MPFPTIDHSHDPALKSWVESANGHRDFPIQNLPLGIFSVDGDAPRAGVAIGDDILDLAATAAAGLLGNSAAEVPDDGTLNALLARPAQARLALRHALSALLADSTRAAATRPHLHPANTCTLHLPVRIGDYTDFYAGIHHATNVGRLLRPDNPLSPNYKHVPIGYHGRASSIRPSHIPVVRPSGQRKAWNADTPIFSPTRRLDYEVELGIWIGPGNALGTPIPIADASDHIAGFCLLNDWSARDFQAWEYVPLGPFLAKSVQSTISPWVVTAEAMAPFRLPQPPRPADDPQPLPYLFDAVDQAQGALSLTVEASLSTAQMRETNVPPQRLSSADATNLYWTVQQLVAHHASNGCNLNPGDLLGTGTISAPIPGSYGSLLELTEGGKKPLTLPDGETRAFLEDGDEVTLTATAHAEGYIQIGFGPCRAKILPAL